MKNLVTRYYFHYYGIIEGCIEKTGRLNMLEWFLLTNYSPGGGGHCHIWAI